MPIECSLSTRITLASVVDPLQSQTMEIYKEEIKSFQLEIEAMKANEVVPPNSLE